MGILEQPVNIGKGAVGMRRSGLMYSVEQKKHVLGIPERFRGIVGGLPVVGDGIDSVLDWRCFHDEVLLYGK